MKYAKIFDSIWEGSMRGKSDPLFVFVNLLTHSDQHGIVDRHWRAIADETGLSQERITNAIEFLESPDHESRTPDEEGRRIVRLDDHRAWGWRIVNHSKYRDLCTKTQNAERQARFRKSNAIVTHSNGQVTPCPVLPVGVGVVVDVVDSVLDKGVQWEKVELPFESEAFKQAWQDFVDHRKAKKAKMTKKAIQLIFKDMPKTESDAIASIEQSIKHGWTGVFPVKKENNQSNQQKPATFLQATDEDKAHMERKKRDAENNR